MPLVKAQCTSCGAALEVDSSKDAAICPFCNTPYIVEKAINQYVTNFNGVINVVANDSKEREFENAFTQLRFGDFKKAEEMYYQLSEKYASDPRAWDGLLNAITKNGTIRALNYYNNHLVINKYYKNLETLDAEMAQKWFEKIEEWKSYYKSDAIEYLENEGVFNDLKNINTKVENNRFIAGATSITGILSVMAGIIGFIINWINFLSISPEQFEHNIFYFAAIFGLGLVLLTVSKYFVNRMKSYKREQDQIKGQLEKYEIE